jgi:tetratricopeptide (TPR) repeat protein
MDGAIADLNQAVLFDPANPANYQTRAEIYSKTRDWDADVGNWSEAILLNPTNTAFLWNRGFVYENHKKDFSRAIADFDKAIEINPQDPNGYTMRGRAYQIRNQLEKAITDFTKAVQIEPTNEIRYLQLENAYFKNGQYKEARNELKEAIRLNPKKSFLYSQLACFLAICPDASFRNGKEAVEAAERGCQLAEKGQDCAYALAMAYAEAGDFDKAIQYQKECINLSGQQPDEVAAKEREILALFEQHKPYHEPPRAIQISK